MILEKENIHFNKNREHYYSILHSRIHYSNKSGVWIENVSFADTVEYLLK